MRGEGGNEAGAEQGKTEQRWGDERSWLGRGESRTGRKDAQDKEKERTRRKPRSRNRDGKMDLMEGKSGEEKETSSATEIGRYRVN